VSPKWRKGKPAKDRTKATPQKSNPTEQQDVPMSPELPPSNPAQSGTHPPTANPPAQRTWVDALVEKAGNHPFIILLAGVIGAVVGVYAVLSNVDKRHELAINDLRQQFSTLKSGIDATVIEKVNGTLTEFAKRTQEIEKQNEILRVAHEREAAMSTAMCRGDYEAALAAYDELRNRFPMSAIPDTTRNGIYEVLVKALVERGDYGSMRRDEIEDIEKSLSTWHSRGLCFSTDYYLGICLMAVGKPEDARKRLFHSVEIEAKKSGSRINQLDSTYVPLMLTCLLDPKSPTEDAKIAAAMALLDECEVLVAVSYSNIASTMMVWESYVFVQHLRRNNGGTEFAKAYKRLTTEILKNQDKMKEVTENGSRMLKGTVILNGTPTPYSAFLGGGLYPPPGVQPEGIAPPRREGTEPPKSIYPLKKEGKPGASAPLPSGPPPSSG
jgi:hypothetical protein